MRPAELDVGLRNACHSDLVISASHERCECRNEGNLASGSQARCCADHVLFGNEHFKKTCGVRLRKFFGERGILRITVKRDDVRILLRYFHQRVTVSFACRRGFTGLAGDCDIELALEPRYRETCAGFRNKLIWAKRLIQFGQCLWQILFRNRLTVPTFSVFKQRHTFALESFCQEGARLRSAVTSKHIERVYDLVVIMTIDRLSEPPEGAELVGEAIALELIHRPPALS